MNLKSVFLTLSMREQICLAIIFLNLFSLIVILCVSCSFSYDILKEVYNQKKRYFFDKYKEYIELSFYFQNFCLLQYEEIIKRMQYQSYKYHRNSTIYNMSLNYNHTKTIDEYAPFFNSTKHKDISHNNDLLFIFCYNTSNTICSEVQKKIMNSYDTLSSLIFSHDIYKTFSIPGYGVPILNSPIVIDTYNDAMFSFNGSKIYEIILERNSNYRDYNNILNNDYNKGDLVKYYRYDVAEVMIQNIAIMLGYFLNGSILFQFEKMFEKTTKEMMELEETKIRIPDNPKLQIYIISREISGYFSSVKFSENKFSFISYTGKGFFYIESSMIEDYLYFLHNRLSLYLDISFIPLHYTNNTIISPELCISFLLKHSNYELDNKTISELYNKLKKGISTITDCFLHKNIFDKQLTVNDIFIKNCSHFMIVQNVIYQGILDSKEYPYYYMKYTYPSYNVLKEFQTDYLLLDQVNFYLFASFKEPIIYSEFIYQIYKNCFIFIIIMILYTWIFCLIINLIIFGKVIKQLTEPIKKIQEAIESSSIKDENIFKYEYDEFINDLFLTCKELLSGQIDNNNEKGLGQFNILSIPKDKKNIDKNIYEKNLIINNDIMNQLIREHQNMMDFSKNIKINEILEKGDNDIINKKKSIQIQDDHFELNPTDSNDKEHLSNKQNNIKQNKLDEEKDREPYKKLFKISEYLFYYQNKVENNYINIVNNVIKDESKKSNISRISNNANINGSLKISAKLKKPIVKEVSVGKIDDNENISINMLDNKNITYLWYMEAKKKKNKSINYHIGNNYNELFSDYNNYQNNHENNKKNNH